MHDAAFDFAYKYIKPKDYPFGNNNPDEYGDYVKLNRVFDFVDLPYLEKVVSQGGLLDYYKKESKKKADEHINEKETSLNTKQFKAAKNALRDKANKIIKAQNQEFDDVHDLITMVRKLIPYSRMLLSADGYLIPLDDKYFRINPDNLGFKYGGDITCVGVYSAA